MNFRRGQENQFDVTLLIIFRKKRLVVSLGVCWIFLDVMWYAFLFSMWRLYALSDAYMMKIIDFQILHLPDISWLGWPRRQLLRIEMLPNFPVLTSRRFYHSWMDSLSLHCHPTYTYMKRYVLYFWYSLFIKACYIHIYIYGLYFTWSCGWMQKNAQGWDTTPSKGAGLHLCCSCLAVLAERFQGLVICSDSCGIWNSWFDCFFSCFHLRAGG